MLQNCFEIGLRNGLLNADQPVGRLAYTIGASNVDTASTALR